MGQPCRYDGGENLDEPLRRLLEERGEIAHAFCPEEQGGLPTPRPAASLSAPAGEVLDAGGQVLTHAGEDVSAAFKAGAELALAECQKHGIARAYLKERSPSCGVCQTHVNGERVEGPGLTGELLRRAGIETIGIEGRRG
jgi:uncharacterized protein YbbK (DUF523 family)